MKISIKDYNLQNIIYVHNFVLIILIFVFLFVFIYLLLTIYRYSYEVIKEDFKIVFFFFVKRTMVREQMVYEKRHPKLLRQTIKDFLAKRDLFVKRYFFKTSEWYPLRQFFSFFSGLYFYHNIKLEIFWTIIPILFILEMIFPSLSLIADDEINTKGTFYTIGVIGNQWYWSYEINLALGTIKQVSNLLLLEEYNMEHKNLTRLLAVNKSLPISVGVKTSFYITSNDVAHSWALPSLGIKIDAIPGRINLKTIIASRLGLYSGMCSELCGVEHGFMPISVNVLTFSNWWNTIRNSLEEINFKQIYHINDFWNIKKISL